MGGARDVDDACRRAAADTIEQQLGEQKMSQVIDAEGQLETVLRHAALSGDTGVVDEHVQRCAAGEPALGAGAHRSEVAQIERQEFHGLVAGVARDGVDDRLRLGFRTTREDETRPTPCQRFRGGPSDARVGTGDQYGAVVEVGFHGVSWSLPCQITACASAGAAWYSTGSETEISSCDHCNLSPIPSPTRRGKRREVRVTLSRSSYLWRSQRG